MTRLFSLALDRAGLALIIAAWIACIAMWGAR
jgi:hypothetical protein